jgi:hypothetical protein
MSAEGNRLTTAQFKLYTGSTTSDRPAPARTRHVGDRPTTARRKLYDIGQANTRTDARMSADEQQANHSTSQILHELYDIGYANTSTNAPTSAEGQQANNSTVQTLHKP